MKTFLLIGGIVMTSLLELVVIGAPGVRIGPSALIGGIQGILGLVWVRHRGEDGLRALLSLLIRGAWLLGTLFLIRALMARMM